MCRIGHGDHVELNDTCACLRQSVRVTTWWEGGEGDLLDSPHPPSAHQWVRPIPCPLVSTYLSNCSACVPCVFHGIKAIATARLGNIVQKVGASRRTAEVDVIVDRLEPPSHIAETAKKAVVASRRESLRKNEWSSEGKNYRRGIRARMAGWISFVLIAIAPMIAITESGVIPSKPSKYCESIFF